MSNDKEGHKCSEAVMFVVSNRGFDITLIPMHCCSTVARDSVGTTFN